VVDHVRWAIRVYRAVASKGDLMRISPTLVAVCFALSGTPALAWNDFGHMEVAALAWSKLTPAARQTATELLKLNPQYSHWTNGASADERDQIAFVMAATWPDFIKRESDYHSDGADDGDRAPQTAEASQNIGYADHYRHKYWHFVDEPFSPDGTALQPPDKPNAQTQIAALRAKLSDAGAMTDVRSYDLAWLEHLVGDVHQPLHATSRFIRSQPGGDAGGNRIKIRCGSGCRADELHAFWDDVLGTSEDPRAAISAATGLREPDAQSKIADEKAWIEESFEAAKATVYAPPIEVGAGPFTLTEGYKSVALSLPNERVALAGTRLANLLNAALK
jgi:hypothetical protein